jgi:hypothetical protein
MAGVLIVASSATAPKSTMDARLESEAALARAGHIGADSMDKMMRRRVL